MVTRILAPREMGLATRTRDRESQRGSVLVEVALVLILLIMLTFGVMEYGWMFFRLQQLNNAARDGARQAVLPAATNSQVESTVQDLVDSWGLTSVNVDVDISHDDISVLPRGELITVTVSAPYSDMQLVGLPLLPLPDTLSTSVTMAKEGPS